jgi:hypothetical protein
MKNKLVKCNLVAILIVAMVATLSACHVVDGWIDGVLEGLKPPTPQVKEVSISYDNGLSVGENGALEAIVGKEFTLTAVVNEGAPEFVEYVWTMTTDGKSQQVGTGKELSFEFETFDEKPHQFQVTANGVASNTIEVSLAYSAKLVDTGILSSTHIIYDDVLQQSIDNIEEITLEATWNKEAIPVDAQVDIAWTIGDNPTIEGTEKQFKYTPTSVGTYTIKLTLAYNNDVVEHALTIVVIETYSAVDSASIVLEDGASSFGNGEETQYYQFVNSENRDEITLSLNTLPAGETDYDAPITWIVRDRDGQRALESNARQVVFVPQYGETIVKAVVDNVESKQVVIFALTSADKQKYDSYINDTFVWVDGVENGYINDQTDLNRFVQHAYSTRQIFDGTKSSGFPFATPSHFDFIGEDNSQPLIDTLHTIDESGKISVNRSWSENSATGERSDYVLYVTDESRFMTPSQNYSPATEVKQDETALVHFSKLDDSNKRTMLPVDDNPVYPDPITNSQMLFRVLGWGYKPMFSNSADSQKMQALYNNIRQVALDYITDEMSDYEKTLIIYEWIAQKVDYDYAIVEGTLEDFESLTYNAFSLEGVFCDADGEGYGQAVCDGRAKAFVALCGVEDIKAVRVTGNSQVNGAQERHAWNKVLIDINGDGKKEWFMCDTTWSDRSSATDRTERLNKQYFLVRNLITLYEKVSATEELQEYANEILLRAVDNLTDLFRCKDGEKHRYKEAADLFKNKNITIQTLYKMELPLKSKIKFTTLSLFGAHAHSLIHSMLHKRLS